LAWRPATGALGIVAGAAGAIGMGALAWWVVAAVPLNFLYLGRPDHLSWAFAFAGLLLVPVAARSRAAAAGAVVALSLAFWTKQTAIVAPVAAVLWLAVQAARSRIGWREAALFCGALVALNLAIFALLQLTTESGVWTYAVDLNQDKGNVMGYGEAVTRELRACGLGALVAALLWAPALLRRGRQPDWRWAAAGVLAMFVALDALAAPYFREGLGSVDNHFTGVAWGLGLLAAAAWGLAGPDLRTAALAAAAVLGIFALTQLSSVQQGARDDFSVAVPPKKLRGLVGGEPFGLREQARRRALYHPVFSYLAAERLGHPYPTVYGIQTLVAGGRRPGYFLDAVLERRFDVVFALQDEGPHAPAWGGGRYEDDWVWKLDEAIRTKYRPAPPSLALDAARAISADIRIYDSPGAFVRRSGPDPAPWMARCFGPFDIAGTTWRIASGGGFWCRTQPGGSVLRLVRTRAAWSEIRADGVRTGSGSRLGIRVRDRGTVIVRLGSWRARRALAARDRWVVALPAGRRGDLSVLATQGSAADVDLAAID
jgi:hypothetical protein